MKTKVFLTVFLEQQTKWIVKNHPNIRRSFYS